jgi:hypothetical protein
MFEETRHAGDGLRTARDATLDLLDQLAELDVVGAARRTQEALVVDVCGQFVTWTQPFTGALLSIALPWDVDYAEANVPRSCARHRRRHQRDDVGVQHAPIPRRQLHRRSPTPPRQDLPRVL